MHAKKVLLWASLALLLTFQSSIAQDTMTVEIAQVNAVRHVPIGHDDFVVWEVLYNVDDVGYRDYAVAYDRQVWARPGDIVPLRFSQEHGFYRLDHSRIEAVTDLQTFKDTLRRLGIILR